MTSNARTLAVIGAVIVATAIGYWIWYTLFSQAAQIEAMHQACIAEFTVGADKARADRGKGAGDKSPDPGAAIAKGISEGFAKLIASLAGGVATAVCGTIRDACETDFEGRICLAARERYGR